jgi:hypothetical protein
MNKTRSQKRARGCWLTALGFPVLRVKLRLRTLRPLFRHYIFVRFCF